jgi:hypothetical protein
VPVGVSAYRTAWGSPRCADDEIERAGTGAVE